MRGLHLPEWVKNLLIVVLSLSALCLFTLSPLYLNSPLRGWTGRLFAGGEGAASVPVSLTAAARPTRMVVTNSAGRYGIQYDDEAVGALFDHTGALLGEALGSASAPASIPQQRWRQALEGEGVYFDFTGHIPFSALTSWLRPGEGSDLLPGDVRRLVLAPGDDGAVWLYYQDPWNPYTFFGCATALSVEAHLDPVLSAFAPNGAAFAFEDQALSRLSPYTLITGGMTQAADYQASSPLASGGEALEAALSGLSFSGALVASYTVDEGTVYRLGEDTLLLTRDGSLTYRGTDGSLYPTVCAGTAPTLAEMIETTHQLISAAVEPLCGDARVYLISARQDGDSTVITYGYSLNGAEVLLGSDGWAAQFHLTGGALTGFSMHLRCYTADGGFTPLLPPVQAAAAMSALHADRSELLLVYPDTGGDAVRAIWTAA